MNEIGNIIKQHVTHTQEYDKIELEKKNELIEIENKKIELEKKKIELIETSQQRNEDILLKMFELLKNNNK